MPNPKQRKQRNPKKTCNHLPRKIMSPPSPLLRAPSKTGKNIVFFCFKFIKNFWCVLFYCVNESLLSFFHPFIAFFSEAFSYQCFQASQCPKNFDKNCDKQIQANIATLKSFLLFCFIFLDFSQLLVSETNRNSKDMEPTPESEEIIDVTVIKNEVVSDDEPNITEGPGNTENGEEPINNGSNNSEPKS